MTDPRDAQIATLTAERDEATARLKEREDEDAQAEEMAAHMDEELASPAAQKAMDHFHETLAKLNLMDALDHAHARINALGGVPSNDIDEAVCDTVGKALSIIEDLGGMDPGIRKLSGGKDAGDRIDNMKRELATLRAQVTDLAEALEQAKVLASEMRHSRKFVAPREYENHPERLRIYEKTRYHDGKKLMEILRAVAEKVKGTQNG